MKDHRSIPRRSRDPVDLGWRDSVERDAAGEVDIAEVIDTEGDGVHPPIALEKPPVDRLGRLVGPTGHEGIDGQEWSRRRARRLS